VTLTKNHVRLGTRLKFCGNIRRMPSWPTSPYFSFHIRCNQSKNRHARTDQERIHMFVILVHYFGHACKPFADSRPFCWPLAQICWKRDLDCQTGANVGQDLCSREGLFRLNGLGTYLLCQFFLLTVDGKVCSCEQRPPLRTGNQFHVPILKDFSAIIVVRHPPVLKCPTWLV
jgi:hypothetical protein